MISPPDMTILNRILPSPNEEQNDAYHLKLLWNVVKGH